MQDTSRCWGPSCRGSSADSVAHAYALQARGSGPHNKGSRCGWPLSAALGSAGFHGASVDEHFVQYKASWRSTTLTPASLGKATAWKRCLSPRKTDAFSIVLHLLSCPTSNLIRDHLQTVSQNRSLPLIISLTLECPRKQEGSYWRWGISSAHYSVIAAEWLYYCARAALTDDR